MTHEAKNKLCQIELILEFLAKDSYIEKIEKPAWIFENGKRLYELETQIKQMESDWAKGELNPVDFQELWLPASKVLEAFKRMLEVIHDGEKPENAVLE
jgi:hypothetical protein